MNSEQSRCAPLKIDADFNRIPLRPNGGRKLFKTKEIEKRMLRLKKTFTIMLPVLVLAIVPTARPQSPPARTTSGASPVTVDGTTYNVTPMGGPRRARCRDGKERRQRHCPAIRRRVRYGQSRRLRIHPSGQWSRACSRE
jgi:hypothetical protein